MAPDTIDFTDLGFDFGTVDQIDWDAGFIGAYEDTLETYRDKGDELTQKLGELLNNELFTLEFNQVREMMIARMAVDLCCDPRLSDIMNQTMLQEMHPQDCMDKHDDDDEDDD